MLSAAISTDHTLECMLGNAQAPYLFNISGPYAVGKDTILDAIVQKYGPSIHRVRTITTRPVYPEDVYYEHVDPAEFERRIHRGKWIANYQLSGESAYGTSVDEIHMAAESGLISVHSVFAGPHGAGSLRELFGRGAVSVGLLAGAGSVTDQLATLRQRLLVRNRDAPDAIEARLRHQVEPLNYVIENGEVTTPDGAMRVFDHVVVNEELEKTVDRVLQVFQTNFIEARNK